MKIGYGTWGLGGVDYGKISEKQSFDLINFAIKKKINFFDTAPLYGDGRVEKLLGKVLEKHNRKKIMICTKCGMFPHRGFVMKQSFSSQKIKSDFYSSLDKLKTSYIDILLLHSPDIKKIKLDKILSVINELKKNKKLKFFGISLRNPKDIFLIDLKYLKKINYIETNFNLLDQRAYFQNILKHCKKYKIKTICRTPLGFGFLTDKKIKKNKLYKHDHRRNWSHEQFKKWEFYKKSFNRIKLKYKISLSEFAILFCLSHSFDYVIPGMLKKREIENNVSLNTKNKINNKDLREIRKIYLEIENQIFVQSRKR